MVEVLFGVKYSLRSIERIMKKLDYTYTKPYKIYAKMLKDAEEQLKKTPDIFFKLVLINIQESHSLLGVGGSKGF